MNKRLLKNIEWGILICTILLIVIGLVALFSATQNAEYDEFKKQIYVGISKYPCNDCCYFNRLWNIY